MTLSKPGTDTLAVEVLNISKHGIWLLVIDQEYFLSYKSYPWFEDAKVKEINNVLLLHESHLYWPDLDIDLEVESLQNPEKYPLVYK